MGCVGTTAGESQFSSQAGIKINWAVQTNLNSAAHGHRSHLLFLTNTNTMFALKSLHFSCMIFPLTVHLGDVEFCLAGGQCRRVVGVGGKQHCLGCGISSFPLNSRATSNILVRCKRQKKSSTKSKGKKTCSSESRNRTVVDKTGYRGLVGALFQFGDWIQIRELSGFPAVFQRYTVSFLAALPASHLHSGYKGTVS